METFTPVYVSINDEPRAILSVMDELLARSSDHLARYKRRRWLPLIFFLAGLPFIGIDLALGYNVCTFSLVTLSLWAGALVTFLVMRRGRLGPQLSPHYQTAREIMHTLRDDLQPKGNFLGHRDLTGAQQPSKLSREGTTAIGLAVQFYRDEWLSLKAKLYDGNLLRLSAIERAKVRKGYYKRGSISGKQKWKPPKVANAQELQVRIAVNPQVYEIVARPEAHVGAAVGQYTVNELNISGGIIRLSASAPATTIQPADVLGALRLSYDLLQRKG